VANTVFAQGFEGQLYYGPAGSTASTLLLNVTEATENFTVEVGDTTPRGDGSISPIGSESVTKRVSGYEFTMLRKKDDTALAAMLVAMYAGTPIALRSKDWDTGLGVDADFIIQGPKNQPRTGEQTVAFTATITRDGGREPQLNV